MSAKELWGARAFGAWSFWGVVVTERANTGFSLRVQNLYGKRRGRILPFVLFFLGLIA